MMEPSLWQKWMHTWRISLLLEHDRPLPAGRLMHQPNASGHYDVAACRQAASALSNMLNDWATFVLVENVSYVKIMTL
jgi:hypothetical protein